MTKWSNYFFVLLLMPIGLTMPTLVGAIYIIAVGLVAMLWPFDRN